MVISAIGDFNMTDASPLFTHSLEIVMRTLGLFAMALVFGSASLSLRAQDVETDCDGCKDHPMLARYPGSILFGADQNLRRNHPAGVSELSWSGGGAG